MDKLKELYSLEGKTCIVTGASSGLGLSQAIMLAQCGARVFALSRSGKPKVDVEEEIPDQITFDRLDVASEEDIEKKITEIGEQYGIDVLVNNAGITKRVRAEQVTLAE